MAKKRHTHTTIEHHHDKSHTMHRHFKHEDGSESKESSAHHSLDDLHDAIQEHMGTPNPGEAEADAGQHGVPPEQAAAAGLAAPAGPVGAAPAGV